MLTNQNNNKNVKGETEDSNFYLEMTSKLPKIQQKHQKEVGNWKEKHLK